MGKLPLSFAVNLKLPFLKKKTTKKGGKNRKNWKYFPNLKKDIFLPNNQIRHYWLKTEFLRSGTLKLPTFYFSYYERKSILTCQRLKDSERRGMRSHCVAKSVQTT